MLWTECHLRRNFHAAAVGCLRTTVGEGATGRAVADKWSDAGDRLQLKARPNIRCCRHQRTRVRMCRIVEHLSHRPLLDNATCIHDDESVSEILHDGKIVSDIEHGDVMLSCKSAHGSKDVGLSRNI